MQIKIPHAISAYVQATNERNNDAFGALFTEDAIVHDEEQEHRGAAAIRRWLTSTVEKYQFTLTPTSLSQEGTESILTAKLSGNWRTARFYALRNSNRFSANANERCRRISARVQDQKERE